MGSDPEEEGQGRTACTPGPGCSEAAEACGADEVYGLYAGAIRDGVANCADYLDRIADLVVSVSGHERRPGAHLVASMISGMLTSCAREAVIRGRADLDDAAALCEQFLYSALRGLDPQLMDAVDPSG